MTTPIDNGQPPVGAEPFDGVAVLFRSVPVELADDEPVTVRFILSLRSGERLRSGQLRIVSSPTPAGEPMFPPRAFNADDALHLYLRRPGGPEDMLFVAPYRALSAVVITSAYKQLLAHAREILPPEQVHFVAAEKPLGPSWLALHVRDAAQFAACFADDCALYLPGWAMTIFLFSAEERRALLPRRWGRLQWDLSRESPSFRRVLDRVDADPKRLVAVLRSDPVWCFDVKDFVYQVPAESADRVARHLRTRLESAGCRFLEVPEDPKIVSRWFWGSELVVSEEALR